METIEIQLSKTKTLLMIAGSILFVLSGIFLLNITDLPLRFNPIVVKSTAVLCIIFFGMTGAYGIKKLFDDKTGLLIDENGIFDNTNAVSIGLIEWADITGIEVKQIATQKFIMVYISNPDVYINKASGMKRKLMQQNNKFYGSPVSITSNSLKCNLDYLEKKLNSKLSEWRAKNKIA